jgi:hypothetical protein
MNRGLILSIKSQINKKILRKVLSKNKKIYTNEKIIVILYDDALIAEVAPSGAIIIMENKN